MHNLNCICSFFVRSSHNAVLAYSCPLYTLLTCMCTHYMHARTHIERHRHTHTHTTHTHAHTYTYTTHTDKHRHTETLHTHRHTDTQTHRHTDTISYHSLGPDRNNQLAGQGTSWTLAQYQLQLTNSRRHDSS